MKNDKFKLIKTDKTTPDWKLLYQIQALKNFWNVSKWEKGWYIEAEWNLSVYWNAWISWNARVSWNAIVYWNALVYWNARISWNARVYWNASVSWDASVSWNACVCWYASVYWYTSVSWNAIVSWNALVFWELKLSFGWCFWSKRKDWNVTELENEDEILLIKDYKPANEEKKEIIIDWKTISLSLESYEALKKSLL